MEVILIGYGTLGEVEKLSQVTLRLKKTFGEDIVKYEGLSKVEDHWEGEVTVETLTGHQTYKVEVWND